MHPFSKAVLLIALLAVGWANDAPAAKRTVCTITVNSADEKDAFRKYLPDDQYRFVELVERGRCRGSRRRDLVDSQPPPCRSPDRPPAPVSRGQAGRRSGLHWRHRRDRILWS